jgi:hypothetical protein
MNYTASVFDFFKSPKWGMNLLLGGVCVLIPIVGPLVLMGWHVGGMYGRQNWKDFVSYPDFDFGKFSQNLERGVWPFLVQLVAGIAIMPVAFFVLFVPMFSMIAMIPQPDHHSHQPPELPPAALVMIAMMILGYVAVIGLMMLVSKPLMIRAAMTQDFAKSFDWTFIKSFTARTWLEQLVSVLFLFLAAIALMLVGAIACGVGVYFTMSIIFFAQSHLNRQLYERYLSRGGEPVEVNPKISELPPALPV